MALQAPDRVTHRRRVSSCLVSGEPPWSHCEQLAGSGETSQPTANMALLVRQDGLS